MNEVLYHRIPRIRTPYSSGDAFRVSTTVTEANHSDSCLSARNPHWVRSMVCLRRSILVVL